MRSFETAAKCWQRRHTEQQTGWYRSDKGKKQLNILQLMPNSQCSTDDLEIAVGVSQGLLSFSLLTICKGVGGFCTC